MPGRFRPVWFLFRQFPRSRNPFNAPVIGSVQFRKTPTETGSEVVGNFYLTSGRNPEPRNRLEPTRTDRNRAESMKTVSEPT